MYSVELLNEIELEKTGVVANCRMNRERRLSSYREELGFSLPAFLKAHHPPAWLDLCCGHGRALAEAAQRVEGKFVGVDLVDTFVRAERVQFIETPLRRWEPEGTFDLITCVHGLHYLGDKLGLLTRAGSWLKPEGRILAHLDWANVVWEDGKGAARTALGWLRRNGWRYDKTRRLLQRVGPGPRWPYPFAGADPNGGPNYTGQPAVTSIYRRSS